MPPLISCLMVTQPNRKLLIQKSVACFRRQTYEPCELVIVHDVASRPGCSFERFLRETAPSARIVSAEPGMSLGELRNLAIEQAQGEVVCQWDDDDQYHPERLARQWEAIEAANADACFLASQLHYFPRSRQLFVRDTGQRGIEGTVMHCRDLPVRYPAMGKEEDTVFMRELIKGFNTTVLHDVPWLYLRVYHGGNTWDEKHHRRMMQSAWDVETLRTRQDELTRRTESYEIDRPVTVRGRDGRAFGIEPDAQIPMSPIERSAAGPTARTAGVR